MTTNKYGTVNQQPALAKYQPCGCVVCTCEHETQCQGCGAQHCGTHPVGQIPGPVYQQPAPDVAGLVNDAERWRYVRLNAMTEYKVAAHQLIGIPASVGISEPVEGFAKRPQDIMPAVRDMALRIELLEHQAAERERAVLQDSVNIARDALAAYRKQKGEL